MKLYCLVIFIATGFGICGGLERNRLNENSANINFLLNESGRDPKEPSYPTPPQGTQQSGAQTGRVHDLVNFFNKQGTVTNPTPKPPSYSSVVSGSKPSLQDYNPNGAHNSPTLMPQNSPGKSAPSSVSPLKPQTTIVHEPKPSPTNNGPNSHGIQKTGEKEVNPVSSTTPKGSTQQKPGGGMSYSEILSGHGNRGGTGVHSHDNTPKEISNGSTKPTGKPVSSTVAFNGPAKPIPSAVKPTGAPVLPSSIVANNNKQGNRQSNGNTPSDNELQTLSEELLRKDINNAARLITVNYQEKTSGDSKDDKAPRPLLNIPQSVYNIPTIQKFLPLLDNYERDTLVNEYVTPQERNEENAFMDAIMQTQVIRQLMTFLKDKGYVTPDPRQQRDFLKQLWFNLYSRGKGKISSSGFEHVFVSELKNNEVSGLHNWLYFGKEESANRINYLGYLKHTELGDKGAVLKLHFNQQGTDKPVDTMFIGTSAELEIALYSLCFITRADQECPLKLGGKNIKIITHTFRYRSKNMIGSAYPQIA